MGKRRSTNAGKKGSADEITIACEQVMFCLQPSIRSNITVFNLKSDNDLSDTIFRSIAKCKRINLIYFDSFLLFITMCLAYEKLLNQKKEDEKNATLNNDQYYSKKKDQVIESSPLLELAMDWNCIDVAKEFVLQNSLENIPVYIYI